MSLEFKEREKEGILLLDLTGQLKFGEEDLQLQQRMTSLVDRSRTKVVVNLAHVDAIDVTGIGTLRLYLREFQNREGKLVLLNPPLSHLEPSIALELETEFEIFELEQEAVNSFFPGRASRRIDLLEFIRRIHGPAQT